MVGDLRSYTPTQIAEKIIASGRAHEGERKQVTVLFADVKDSMDLSERLDPEAWHRVMDRFFTLLCAGVQRYEGTVGKFTGDGIMALFGTPIALEDHARRACHAALALMAELADYSAQLRDAEGLDFSVRLGLNSGEVVLGTVGEELNVEYTTVGHTVGLAQRMEQLAEPGAAYLTERTAALVSGYFELEGRGPFEIKGMREPLRVYELRGPGAARTALDVALARGLSRFVGRDPELRTLEAALEHALQGSGQVVGVVSDPGLGKSRLAFEFAGRCRARGIPVYEGHAAAHGKTIPFLPVLEMLRSYFGVSEQDPDDAAREKVTSVLLSLDRAFEDGLPLLLDFLGVPDPERPTPYIDPEARQGRLLAIVKRLVHARSRREAAVTIIEDLHWIDPASELFVEALVEAVPATRTLVLVTLRPEYEADWMRRSYYQQLPLAPLDREAMGALLGDLLGSDSSLDGLAELVRERTGGNPFFIEEAVQALVESGTLEGERGAHRLVRSIDEVTVPATVQAVLAGRIDRLSDEAKGLLQTAAVIGKHFPEAVLRQVSDLSGAELDEALRTLATAEFLYEEMLTPEAYYTFKHPLTQEVAYSSQLTSRRAWVHAAVARALADLYPERLDERAALIAHHWEAAGERLEAARWSRRAAEWAGVMDPREAMRSWRKVKQLAGAAPEAEETVALGQTARIWILLFGWRLGMSKEEADAVLAEGRTVAERSGDPASLAMLLTAFGPGLAAARQVERLVELSLQARRLADESGVLEARLYVRSVLAYALDCSGRPAEGVAVCEEGVELTGGDPTIGIPGVGSFIPGVGSFLAFFIAFRAQHLASLGRLGEAAAERDRAIRIAREQRDIERLCWALDWQVYGFARYAGDARLALDYAREAVEIAEAIGGPHSLVWSYGALGCAHVLNEDWSEAVRACERSRAIANERGVALELLPRVLGHLAEAYLGSGDERRARRTAEEAVKYARGAGLRLFGLTSELALGRVLLRAGDSREHDEAEAVLRGGLELAREIGARSEEPLFRVELAELARLRGDETARRRELQDARRLFSEVGATARAEQLARQLETVGPAAGG